MHVFAGQSRENCKSLVLQDKCNIEIFLSFVKKKKWIPGRIAQSVTCLATDACLTAIPGVASSIPARSHTFVEIDHEIISTVILLPSADPFKKGCCQLQAKVCARITGYPLVQACPGKSVVRWTDRPAMTIAVDLGRKATKPTKIVWKWLIFQCEFCVLFRSMAGGTMEMDSWG